MTLRRTLRRGLAAAVVLAIAVAAAAPATTVGRICRTMCAPARAACGDDARCVRTVAKRCRHDGPSACALAYCIATATTTTITTPATRATTTTTTPGATSTTVPVVGRFVDDGDGTLLDTQTGLTWERKDALDGVADLANPHDADNLYSSAAAAPGAADLATFLAQLDAAASCFAGQCDWRLPTLVELQTIQLYAFPCDVHPCIDPAFGPTASDFYWSSTSYDGDPAYVWGIYFTYGSVGLADVADLNYARAVRGP